MLLQLRKRRLNPTSFTWVKHVLLHSDQLVHLLHGPSATSVQETHDVLLKQLEKGHFPGLKYIIEDH